MFPSIRYPALLFALIAPSAWAQSEAGQTKDLAISGARIEVGNGTVIPHGNVIVHNGKISAVGENAAIPAGATVVDGTGLTVYPGFIDAYATDGLKLPEQPSYGTPPDSRNTAPPTMWHGNRKGIRSDILAAKCLDVKGELTGNFAQGVTTALLAPGNGTIRGTAAVVDYTPTGNTLSPAAGVEISFRSGSGQGYPGTLFGIIANLRQVLADAQYACAQEPKVKEAALENLRPLVTQQIPCFFDADSAREIVRANRVADEFNFKMILVGGKEAYRDLDLIKAKKESVIVNVDPGFEPSLKPETEVGSAPLAVLKERHQTWVEHTENAKKLADAGVPFAFTAGSGMGDFLKNIRKVIATGVSKDAALHALTGGAAEILGVSDKVGTIETGKFANLVLMTGDFADDKSEVQSVVVEGSQVQVKKPAVKETAKK